MLKTQRRGLRAFCRLRGTVFKKFLRCEEERCLSSVVRREIRLFLLSLAFYPLAPQANWLTGYQPVFTGRPIALCISADFCPL